MTKKHRVWRVLYDIDSYFNLQILNTLFLKYVMNAIISKPLLARDKFIMNRNNQKPTHMFNKHDIY